MSTRSLMTNTNGNFSINSHLMNQSAPLKKIMSGYAHTSTVQFNTPFTSISKVVVSPINNDLDYTFTYTLSSLTIHCRPGVKFRWTVSGN